MTTKALYIYLMKIFYLTLAFLLEASAIPDQGTPHRLRYSQRLSLRFRRKDKTGLRKQCIQRYVILRFGFLDVSNPTATAYTNAKNEDPDLFKGGESFSCYTQGAEVDAVMLQHNIKDSETTVTSSYTKKDIPAGFAYSDSMPEPTTLDQFVQHQLDYINKLRARHGSPLLSLDDDLSIGALALADKNKDAQ